MDSITHNTDNALKLSCNALSSVEVGAEHICRKSMGVLREDDIWLSLAHCMFQLCSNEH